jgi:hypothetical protein
MDLLQEMGVPRNFERIRTIEEVVDAAHHGKQHHNEFEQGSSLRPSKRARMMPPVAVTPYFSLFLVFFSPAPIATVPHIWLSHGCHAEATRSFCSTHSASFASRITGYLVTRPFWTLVQLPFPSKSCD